MTAWPLAENVRKKVDHPIEKRVDRSLVLVVLLVLFKTESIPDESVA